MRRFYEKDSKTNKTTGIGPRTSVSKALGVIEGGPDAAAERPRIRRAGRRSREGARPPPPLRPAAPGAASAGDDRLKGIFSFEKKRAASPWGPH
ncbi:hypothetical protein EVAR_104014_1 [Eumeta japonica]|uniref:Uncharacterized protein n=1 Tax=Eumeta variegata TaxID=151549 RepID=A0A4C1XZC3_EUMVA|nr:hypothetical protein EVAR_104014_1 [Eumeta japonica]